MKRLIKKLFLFTRFLVLFVVRLAAQIEDEYCSSEDATSAAIAFRMLYKDACSAPPNLRIYEATYSLSSSCAQRCLQDPFCAGYNFKNILQKRNFNCQLTPELNYNMSNCNKDDKGWVFYHLLVHREVPCSKMKNCKNGGKTVIDLKDGPGSDPYKCQCPKEYWGYLCQYYKDVCPAPQPLGMESGQISDEGITASSSYNANYQPYYARLRKVGGNCTWEPHNANKTNSWLQVDLGKLAIVTGIATQGTCLSSTLEWTKSYSISYSKDGNNWEYFQESRSTKVFQANADKNTIVTHGFKNTQTRYLRVWPKTWLNYPAIRLEYYGCYL